MTHIGRTVKSHTNYTTMVLIIAAVYLVWPAVFGTDNAPQQTIEAPQ